MTVREPPVRAGASHATIYPYGPFPAGDGKVVMLGLQNEREWAVFCDKVLEQPGAEDRCALLVGPAPLGRAQGALRASSSKRLRKLTAEQIVERLDEAQIGNARMNDMRDLWEHAQLRARKRWVDIDTPVGKIKAMLPPGVPESFEPRMDPIPGDRPAYRCHSR